MSVRVKALLYPGVAYCAVCGFIMRQIDRHPNLKKGVWMECTRKYVDWNEDRSVEEYRSYECRNYGKRILIRPTKCA